MQFSYKILLFFSMIDWTMNCEPFSRNFSLTPAEIGFKYRKVSSYSLLYIENTVQKNPCQIITYLCHSYLNYCPKLHTRHLFSELTGSDLKKKEFLFYIISLTSYEMPLSHDAVRESTG